MGTAVSAERFERNVRVECHEIGAAGRIRLSSILRMEQETSEEHMTALGLSYEKMLGDGIAMLITENQVQVFRFPVSKEQLHIVTRPAGAVGVHFYREFLFYSGTEQLMQVRQVSVCVDCSTHRPLRPDALYQYHVFQKKPVPPEQRVKKIRVKPNLAVLGERPIRYSDLDMNRHLTNTIYGDIVEDFLPESFRDWKRVQINYQTESLLGDVLQISGEETVQEKEFVLAGQSGGTIRFSTAIQK